MTSTEARAVVQLKRKRNVVNELLSIDKYKLR